MEEDGPQVYVLPNTPENRKKLWEIEKRYGEAFDERVRKREEGYRQARKKLKDFVITF